MTGTTVRRSFAAVLSLGMPVTAAMAQRAVTVSGHVTSGTTPLVGAHVRLTELSIDRTTNADGRYSFLIPSISVRGQSVHVVATMGDRRIRYIPKSAVIELNGTPVVQDFDLAIASEGQVIPEPAESQRSPGVRHVDEALSDTANLGGIAGTVDLASALAGRVPGLDVRPASVLGGSALLLHRGPHSILGSNQPMYVVDGLPVDNTVFASAAQRFGAGGFDYGSPLADLDLADVESIKFLSASEAGAAFGGRAANGVVSITTKSGKGGPHIAVSASYQRVNESFVQIPTFQNQFGQGLDGKFEFFNGRGGGINDAVDQSWGPALDGRPLAQASYREAARPDVRLWTAHQDNVRHFFDGGSTSNVTAAFQGQSDIGSFRFAGGDRESNGISPGQKLSRLNGAAHFTFHPTNAFNLSANVSGAETKNDNAPGSGYNEGNPFAEFTRMGRQVDTDSLKNHLRDAAGQQVSWNYSGHNNPFFAPLADSNYSRRYHVAGSATATYAMTPWLTATARGGSDYYHEGRLFAIAPGWMGGFPFYAGAGNFSRGGSEGDLIAVHETNALVRLDAIRPLANGKQWTFGGGIDLRDATARVQALGVDSVMNVPAAGAPDTAKLPGVATWSGDAKTTAVFGETSVRFGNGAVIAGSVRGASAGIVSGHQSTSVYPAIHGGVDLVRSMGVAKGNPLTSAVIRGGWSRNAADLTPYAVETMYAGRSASGAIAPFGASLLSPDPDLAPEITSAFELGSDLGFRANRLLLGLTYYRESTSGVILPVADAASGTLVARNVAQVSNNGVEAQIALKLGDGDLGFGWDVSADASKNSNNVDQLSGALRSVPLGPQQWGMSVDAQPGMPLGVLMGRRYLRDASTNALILRNGLPLPDTVAGAQALGSAQPDWIFGLRSTLRYRWVSVSAIADGHMGGEIFSGTNLWGSYAGTLATTAFRPDSGLLISGVDATTHSVNTKHVTAQDYFHALGAIQEPWVYSASYFKLRELRVSLTLPAPYGMAPFSSVTASLVGRNLYTSSKAPNIDPQSVFSPYQLPGVEMGQLPATRSLGLQLTITP